MRMLAREDIIYNNQKCLHYLFKEKNSPCKNRINGIYCQGDPNCPYYKSVQLAIVDDIVVVRNFGNPRHNRHKGELQCQ